MHIDYLVRMANDIGAFFANEEDQSVAAESIRQHIQRYWDPRMRSRIIGVLQRDGRERSRGAGANRRSAARGANRSQGLSCY